MEPLDIIAKQLADDSKSVQNALLAGSITTMEEYKRLMGKLQGLSLAAGYITDLQKSLMNDD